MALQTREYHAAIKRSEAALSLLIRNDDQEILLKGKIKL